MTEQKLIHAWPECLANCGTPSPCDNWERVTCLKCLEGAKDDRVYRSLINERIIEITGKKDTEITDLKQQLEQASKKSIEQEQLIHDQGLQLEQATSKLEGSQGALREMMQANKQLEGELEQSRKVVEDLHSNLKSLVHMLRELDKDEDDSYFGKWNPTDVLGYMYRTTDDAEKALEVYAMAEAAKE